MADFKLSYEKKDYNPEKVFGMEDNSENLFTMLNNILVTYLEKRDYDKYDSGTDMLKKVITEYKTYIGSRSK